MLLFKHALNFVTSGLVKDFLSKGNSHLMELNMKNAKKLMSGEGLEGAEQLKGKDLDYKLVEIEQRAVGKFIDVYFNGRKDKDDIIKEINGLFSLPVAHGDVKSVLQKHFQYTVQVGMGSVTMNSDKPVFNFENLDHRILLGEKLVDKLYEREKK